MGNRRSKIENTGRTILEIQVLELEPSGRKVMTPLLLLRNGNRAFCLLSVGHRSQVVNSVAFKHRGPRRFMGKTRAQLLDHVLAKNAYFWLVVAFGSFSLVSFLIYRFQYVVLPEQEALKEKVEAELLAEGRYE